MKTMKRLKKALVNNKKRYSDDIREISYDKLKKLIKENTDLIIIDIRSPQEFEEKKIKNSINIPLYDIKKNIDSIISDKNRLIVLYCACGVRSKKAYKILQEKGYNNLYSLEDGINGI